MKVRGYNPYVKMHSSGLSGGKSQFCIEQSSAILSELQQLYTIIIPFSQSKGGLSKSGVAQKKSDVCRNAQASHEKEQIGIDFIIGLFLIIEKRSSSGGGI